jgi:methyltransferase-like protein 23
MQPPTLHTSEGETYPLHDYHLRLAGREWTILHTGVVLTYADELQFFRDLLNHIPYGVALWPSAIALAYELASRGEELTGKTVLELGAGTGLPGIVAASLGARVVQTDRQELAMTVCRRNCHENNIAAIEHRLVDWTDWHDESRYDWIIGSDILYGEPMHSPLQHIFETNLAPGGRILLSDPFRGTSLHLLEGLQEQGWNVVASKWSLGDEDNPRPIGVFELSLAVDV